MVDNSMLKALRSVLAFGAVSWIACTMSYEILDMFQCFCLLLCACLG